MKTTMLNRDVTLRYTDKDGKKHTMTHRVWDFDRFIEARIDAARKDGGKVEQIDNPKR